MWNITKINLILRIPLLSFSTVADDKCLWNYVLLKRASLSQSLRQSKQNKVFEVGFPPPPPPPPPWHLWWAEPVLGERPALELPKGLSILMLGCGAQLWMAKPFQDAQWNCSSSLLRGCNNTSKALWCTSASQGMQNTGVTEWILQRSRSSFINISTAVGAMIVKNASCLGV